ncbi:MAG TPA: hypothetical protein VN034_01950 [Sphingopyxis sp.]|nr:hypothetical protein [Sphingopyxis sp.]
MTKWHESTAANIGLRATGLTLLAAAWWLAVRLHHMSQTILPRDATTPIILLSAILFLCASAGSALLFVGPALWETVEISERWRRAPPSGSEAAEAFDGRPSRTVRRPEDGASA